MGIKRNTTEWRRKIHWELWKKLKFDHTIKLESIWDFQTQIDHLILARKPERVIIYKKQTTCRLVDSAVPADQTVKRKTNNWTLLEKLKKPWNIKVMLMSIVTGALGTIHKGLIRKLDELKIKGWAETIQTVALLSSARILRRILEIWGDLLSLRLQWKTIS